MWVTAAMELRGDGNGHIPDRGPQLVALVWVMTGLSSLMVILRFTSRGLRGTFGWDDFMMLFSLVCAIIWNIGHGIWALLT